MLSLTQLSIKVKAWCFYVAYSDSVSPINTHKDPHCLFINLKKPTMSQQLLECPLYIMHGWKKWALKFHLGISHRLRTESDFAFNHQDSGDCAASSINDCKKKTCMEHCQNLSITLHVMMSLGISYLTSLLLTSPESLSFWEVIPSGCR